MSETSPLLPRAMQYGHPSTLERIQTVLVLLPLPAILLWTLLFGRSKEKTVKRVLFNRALRYIVDNLNVRQLQSLFGTTKDVYEKWAKGAGAEPVIEDIGENAKLLWIGERTLDKVVLYLHGGAFLLPPAEFNLTFLEHAQKNFQSHGLNVGIAILQYTLVPEAPFPTPLKQAVSAINHLMNLGVDPQNMQLIGDSAGGNLLLQVLAHLLHPLESERVPALSLPAPFKGAYLMSPWVDLSNIFKTLEHGDKADILSCKTLTYWGSQVLAPVPAKNLDYIEANSASEEWWKGVDAFVDRILITAGSDECLKNEIIRFHSTFENFHSHVKLLVQNGETHNDPFFDFAVGKKDGVTTGLILDWLTFGFQQPTL